MKKTTKAQMKKELEILLRTVWSDIEISESEIIDNEIYHEDISGESNTIQLEKSGRVAILGKKRDLEHVARRLREILEES